ncbi:uncharacterized protein LOC107705902 isoform X2 [Sinocyclocheilus rhinocerous]|uniref:uncharacterized protein LOC107705902 isoform X2 n=1 Tax=Sinocyclocheilus rhinocerous TaxID=307959 RepID=UPI0007BACF66|nr:PREDICTED: uncharacterized protein LOC107705902 isoform X2 [Sinocyclocheilus rhinocerous]
MNWAENLLSSIRQDGRPLARYVEEFVEFSHLRFEHSNSSQACYQNLHIPEHWDHLLRSRGHSRSRIRSSLQTSKSVGASACP